MVSSCRPTPSPLFSSPHSYLTQTTVSCLGVTRSPSKLFGKWQLSRCPYIRPARSSIVFSLRAFCAHSLARSLGRDMLYAFCLCVSSFNFAYSNSSTPLTILSPLCARGPDATNRVPHPRWCSTTSMSRRWPAAGLVGAESCIPSLSSVFHRMLRMGSKSSGPRGPRV